MFKPNIQQMTTPIRIQKRDKDETIVNGCPEISYSDIDSDIYFCNFKPFFGAESEKSGAVGIQDGGTITMWYYPGITSKDRILLLRDDTNLAYEIIKPPENVEMRNQYLILKVQRVVNA